MWRGVEGGRCAKFKLGDRPLKNHRIYLLDTYAKQEAVSKFSKHLFEIYHDINYHWDYPADYNDAYNECYMYKGKCVWFERDARQFQSAARHCAQMGGRLWEPQSVHEYNVINR